MYRRTVDAPLFSERLLWSILAFPFSQLNDSEWVTPLHYSTVDLLLTIRYLVKEEVNGKQQLSPRNSLELYNATTVMHTWMQKNRTPLMCSWVTINHRLVNLRFGSWTRNNITKLEAVVLIFFVENTRTLFLSIQT